MWIVLQVQIHEGIPFQACKIQISNIHISERENQKRKSHDWYLKNGLGCFKYECGSSTCSSRSLLLFELLNVLYRMLGIKREK